MQRPIASMPVRMRRLAQWMLPGRTNYLACLKHGIIYGPMDAAAAAHRTGREPCPSCCAEVAAAFIPQQEEPQCPAAS